MFRSAILFSLLLATFARPAAAQLTNVQFEALDGATQTGALLQITPTLLTAQINGQTQQIATTDLLSVVVSKAANAPAALTLRLGKGTTLRPLDVTGQSGAWNIQLRGIDQPLAIPAEALLALRFRELSTDAMRGWDEAVEAERAADALAVLRSDALEVLDGAISRITAETVEFEFDGQSIPAKREKVAGVIWFHRGLQNVETAVTVKLDDGSTLLCKSLQIDGQNDATRLVAQTLEGFSVALPQSLVSTIDYGSANLKWLADLPSVRSDFQPITAAKLPEDLRQLAFAPRFIAGSFRQAGESGVTPRNLLFTTSGSYTVRIPEGYHRLQSVVQRNNESTAVTPVQIDVICDGNTVWSQLLESNIDKATIDAEIVPNKQVEIRLTSPAAIDVGISTLLLQPRLMR